MKALLALLAALALLPYAVFGVLVAAIFVGQIAALVSADEAGARGDGGFPVVLLGVGFAADARGQRDAILRPVSAAFFHAEHGSVSRPGRRRSSAPRSLRGRGVAASWSRCLLTPLPVAGVGVGALRASALRAVTGLRPVFARQGMIAERVQFLAMCPALGRAFRQFGLACCLTVGLVPI